MSFSSSKEPLDPQYVKFRDGWREWIIDKEQYAGLRWEPKGGRWAAYPLAEWDFIDFGVVGPPSPLERKIEFEPIRTIWRWPNLWVDLPAVWKEIQAVYDRSKASRPAAVWNPYDGSWREMRKRPQSPPRPPPPPPPGTPPSRDPEFIRLSQELYEDYRAGLITERIYNIRLQALEREYS